MPDRSDRIRIFDTTLRDGEQSPGATLTLGEKVEIARALETAGVDVIEAGFPVSSPGDFDSVRAVAETCEKAIICGLARCVPGDIEKAGTAVAPAARKRVHVFCATSKIHREHKLRKGKEDIIDLSVRSIKQALEYTDDVEFSPEDASRTEFEFIRDITAAAIEAGATTINLPDTVGYSHPAEYAEVFRRLIAELPMIGEKNVVLSTHCHDDLGMAVANTLAAVTAGARQVECTINGIGERAGNAALEEIVMALRTRADHFGLDTGVDATHLFPLSKTVSRYTGLAVQRNKAIVGKNAFAHESGIHQDGVLKHRETYEIMNPADVGIRTSDLVLGKHSGRHAFRDRLETLGHRLDEGQFETVFARFKETADKKKEMYDDDLDAIVDDVLEGPQQAAWQITDLAVVSTDTTLPMATIKMLDPEGRPHRAASVGDGPIDAAYSAIQQIMDQPAELTEWRITATTGGRDALGEARVELRRDGKTAGGRGSHTDIIQASARAYVAALNRLATQQPRAVGQGDGV